MKICVIEFPSESNQHEIHLNQFLRILASTTAKVSVITSNIGVPSNLAIHQFNISDNRFGRSTFLRRIARYLTLQLRMCFRLAQMSKNVDTVISFHDYVSNSASILLAKLLGKRLAIYVGGSPSKNIAQCYKGLRGLMLYYTIVSIEHVLLRLCDLVIPLSRSMIEYQDLKKYEPRVSNIDGARYIDTTVFSEGVLSTERDNIIAFIGRLSIEKGIYRFLQSIPQIQGNSNAKVWIIGSGDAENEVVSYIESLNSKNTLRFFGFIPHDKLSNYLRQIKIVVVPSYSEGLPTVILESLACGAIVVACPVGGVPDLVIDKSTGFILENNSPNIIARTVLQVLSSNCLLKIQRNGYNLVRTRYTFDNAVNRWESILRVLYMKES